MSMNYRLPATADEYVEGHGIDLSDVGDPHAGHMRVLVTGTRYVGKTTEVLAAMRTQISKAPVDVLFFDLKAYLGIYHKVLERFTSAEVVGLVGLALARVARERFFNLKARLERSSDDLYSTPPEEVDGKTGLARILALRDQDDLRMTTEADLDDALLPFRKHEYDAIPMMRRYGIGRLVVLTRRLQDRLTSAGLLGRDGKVKFFRYVEGNDDLQWGWEHGDAPLNDEAASRTLVNSVNAILRTFRKPFVIVLDGLDRVTDAVVLRELFGPDSALQGLQASVVSTADFGTVEEARADLGSWDVRPLFPIPVLTRSLAPGQVYSSGQGGPSSFIRGRVVPLPYDGFLRDLATRRLHPIIEKVPEDLLHKVAVLSGGLPGVFIMFLTGWFAQSNARWDKVPKEEDLIKMMDQIRAWFERTSTPERRMVVALATESPTYGEYPQDRATARIMERDGLLVAYTDEGGVWYYPHPSLLCGTQEVAVPKTVWTERPPRAS